MTTRNTPPPAAAGGPSPAAPAGRALRVVAIGGGTGLSTLLKGLKGYVQAPGGSAEGVVGELSAVVTVTDDGGSSGRLRKEFNILPPGDIRNCMVALSEDETLLSRLFQYRFSRGSGLKGHSFGNLFVAALTAVSGDFAEAVKLSSAILATRGHIFPATVANVQLEALMDDGSRVRGETRITASKQRIVKLRLVPANARPLPQTLEAISQADLITLGPGSLFTSLAPNLLVHGIPEAIRASSALKVFVCNLMTQANESLGLTAADHIRALHRHAGGDIFDVALLNTTRVSRKMKARYAREGGSEVVSDVEAVEGLGVRVVGGNFLEEGAVVRHNTGRVARALLALAAERRSGTTPSTAASPRPRVKMVG